MSNAPSKPVSFSRPKVGYFSNRPRTLCGQNVELYLNTQSVPRSKHTPSRIYTNQSVNAIITVCSEMHKTHRYTVDKLEDFLMGAAGGKYIYQFLNGLSTGTPLNLRNS